MYFDIDYFVLFNSKCTNKSPPHMGCFSSVTRTR